MSCFKIALFLMILPVVPALAAGPAKMPDAEAALLKTASALYDGIQTMTLANGLKIYLKPIPGCPIVTTMMAYRVGACDEDLDQTGLSHYLEHLQFKGTDKLVPGDIDRLTQRNGGHNNAYTTEDMTVYHFDFAADRWQIALQIEADRMRNTRIDPKHEFQQEKGAVIQELNRNEDRPWDLESKALLPLLFGTKSPYGHPVIGERKHVEGATAEIIRRHYDRWYHPNNASLVLVGGFDPKMAEGLIEQRFAKIPRADLPERKPITLPPPRMQTVRHKMTSKFEIPRLLIAFNGVDVSNPDSYVLDVLQTAVAGGKTSRLYRKLIDDEQIASSVGASNSSGRYPGSFQIEVELIKNDLGKVEGLIKSELDKVARDGITEAELRRAKRGVVAGYIFGNEDPHSVCNTIAQGVTTKDLDYLKSYLGKIDAVSNDDIKRVARKYLVDAKGVVVWSMPQVEQKEKVHGASGRPAVAAAPGRKSTLRRAPLPTEAGAQGGLALPDARSVTLPNGLKLWLLENHRLPLVVVEASVHQVRMREPADKQGIAALVSLLIQEGTTTRKAEEISQLIEDTGGSLSVTSSAGSVKVLSSDTELGLDLLFDCMMNPIFPEKVFDSKRDELLSAIAEEEKTPNDRAAREFAALVYGKHPFGRSSLGTTASVKKLSRKDCLDFHKALFRPNNVQIAIVGDFESAKVIETVRKLTAAWKSVPMSPLRSYPVEMPEKFVQKVLSDPEAAQLHVYLGHRGIKRDNPDYYKLLVMDNVLGTGPGFTDRLSSTLRDRQGLAYTVSAQIAASAGEEVGTFTGFIGTYPQKFTWVRDSFLKEIRKLRDEAPTAQEVDDAKKYLSGSLAFRTISCDQVAGLLLTVDRLGLGLNYLDDYRKAVSAVTPADVHAVARKYLHPDQLILVAVGAIDAEGQPLKKRTDR